MRLGVIVALGISLSGCKESKESEKRVAPPDLEEADKQQEVQTPKELPADPGPPCTEVVEHLYPVIAHVPGVESRADVLAGCESSWSKMIRECMKGVSVPLAVRQCHKTTVAPECAATFERLLELAKLDGKNDPGLHDKSSAFGEACALLNGSARKCIFEATTLDAFKACPNTEEVAHSVATPALDWRAPDIPGITEWSLKEETSPMDDKKTISAFRLAPKLADGRFRKVRTSIHVRCEGKTFELFVVVRMGVEYETYSDYRSTRIKLDDGKAFKHKAYMSTSGDAMFLVKPKKVAKKLRGKRTMLFEFTPAGRKELILEFPIDGIDAVLDRMSGCGV